MQIHAGLLDRLLGYAGSPGEIRDAILRDLEDLLNTRVAMPADAFQAYPLCAASLFNYGVPDFAGISIRSMEDRNRVCTLLRTAIERHEPRLTRVQARIVEEPGTVNRIRFAISGTLTLPSLQETIDFDAVLQPSTLHYSIKRGAKA
ncbi:type VI secretion system baseplate subunit TssE [Pseudoduganella rhizocola]|uniref:type VI secretion system baseplate subunit TssE n=1 Tax=Pseudoduganella rhizocola TaxID=3382643 RepID=UPI0038B4A2F3